MIRAVTDANVVISGTISSRGPSAKVLRGWEHNHFELVTCPGVLKEIDEKLRQPRISQKYHISDDDVVDLIARLSVALVVPALTAVEHVPPDLDDIMLFSAALESKADYIVTGDKSLLEFAWDGPGKIISPRRFCEEVLGLL